jgi:peptidoglycan/LPS O-acetylase OafA/YrhL
MTAAISSTEARAFRPDIEGLRAIAVALVVLNHAGVSRFAGGYVGVDVFFVLSGFLITGLLLKEQERGKRISLVGFYARRARRILPAGTLVLAVTVLASVLLIGGNSSVRTAEDAQWAAILMSNIHFIQQGTNYWAADLPPSPLQHFWSLSIEEQFYFVWPTCLIAVSVIAQRIPLRTKLTVFLVCVIAASLMWSMRQTADNATAAYFSTFTRVWELAAGALLAVVAPWIVRAPRGLGSMMSLVGVAMIVTAALRFDEFTPFPGSAALLPIGGAVLAVAGGCVAPGGGAEWLLGSAPLQWLGKRSYSLYLWHWPILVIAAGYVGRDLSAAQRLSLVVLAVALSAATFWAIEAPARNSAWLKARPSLVSVAVGATLVIFTLGLASGLKESLPQPTTVEQLSGGPDNPP